MTDILLLGDEKTTLDLLSTLFKTDGYDVEQAVSLDQCWELLDQDDFRLLFIDFDQPCEVLLDFIADMKERYSEMQIIVTCGKPHEGRSQIQARFPNVTIAEKPFKIDRLLECVQNVIEQTELDDARLFSEALDMGVFYQCAEVIAKSASMQSLLRMIERIAATGIPVLISGEKGTDKALIARAIHSQSRQADKAFVAIEYDAAEPAQIFDTPGTSQTAALKKAGGGTLFLDAFETLDTENQRRLLHLVQSAKSARVNQRTRFLLGSTLTSNHLTEAGVLPDLVGLVSGLTLTVPPLRERREDIPLIIAQLMAETWGGDTRRSAPSLDDDAMTALTNYAWPGNVAQLANVIHSLMSKNPENSMKVTVDMLPDDIR